MRVTGMWMAMMACTTTPPAVGPAISGVCTAIGVPVVSGMELPRIPGTPAQVPTEGIYFDAHTDHWKVNGHVFDTLEHAQDPLLAARTATRKRIDDPVLILSAPASMPAARVGAAMRMAYLDDFRTVSVLAFSDQPIQMPPPMNSAYDADLQARAQGKTPAERAQLVATELGDTLTGCKPAQHAMASVAVAPSAKKCVTLASSLSDALPQCPGVDASKVATLARFMATPAYSTRPTAVALTLDRDAAPVPMTGTWQDFVSAQATRTGPVWPQR